MSMRMLQVSVVLLSLAFTSHGMQVPISHNQMELNQFRNRRQPLNTIETTSKLRRALASCLLAFSAPSAFTPSIPATPFSKGVPTLVVSRPCCLDLEYNRFVNRIVLMSDLFLSDPTDASVPRDGARVPEKGSVLRSVPIVRIVPEGCWVLVDPAQGLQGYVYKSGMDNGYVRNMEATFRVGDLLDFLVVEVSTISGRHHSAGVQGYQIDARRFVCGSGCFAESPGVHFQVLP